MVTTTIAGLLLVISLVCGWTAEASICRDENNNPIPCEQDPGGGGSGSWCAHPTCWGCGAPQHDGYSACVQDTGERYCSCEYPDGIDSCGGTGVCEYTGP